MEENKLELIKNSIDQYLSYDERQEVVNHIVKGLVNDLVEEE